jgi:very-short-patch-repair endonuclease
MGHKTSSRRVELDACARFAARLGTEDAIRAITARQHTMINRAQLLAAGLGAQAVIKRLRRGALRQMHRGVYCASPVIPCFGEEMAVILACGEHAWISHASGAYLHKLPPYPAESRPISVTVIGSAVRRPGLRVHRVSTLAADEVTEVEGIPVTTATRAILELAGSAPALLERAVSEGIASRQMSRGRLLELCRRHPGARGVARLRALLEDGAVVTRSRPERLLRRLIRQTDLPSPHTNVRIGKWEVDFIWPEHLLIVEVDALSTHTSPFHFERDRRKDAELTLLGYTVVRVTKRQLEEEPRRVVARIAAILRLTARFVSSVDTN